MRFIWSRSPLAKRDAIRKPLNRLPWKIGYDSSFLDDVLLPHLVRKSSAEGMSLPQAAHLQIICNRLYEEARKEYANQIRDQEPVTIGRDLYDRLGGAEGILEGYLDEILARDYAGEERARAQSILKRMASAQGTRLFAGLKTLSDDSGIPETEVQRILARLESSRLIEVVPGEDRFTLAHEYLVEKINSWYDAGEMELKRAAELFNRSLIDYRTRGYLIPFTVFRDIKSVRARIPMDDLGRNLYGKSARRFYGFRILVSALTLIVAIIAADQSYHLFYLFPRQIGRVSVIAADAPGPTTAKVIRIRGGVKETVETGAPVPSTFRLPRGLYYVEAGTEQRLSKTPVFVDGYANYRNPIVLTLPMSPITSEMDGMVRIPSGSFFPGSPRFRIRADALESLKDEGISADIITVLSRLAEEPDREWDSSTLRDAIGGVIGSERMLQAILKNVEPPSDEESRERRKATIDEFYIDKYEVSNRQYADFLKAAADHRTHYAAEPEYKRRDRGHEPKYWKSSFYKRRATVSRMPPSHRWSTR